MSDSSRAIKQYNVTDNSNLPKVRIKGKEYYYNQGKDQYIDLDNTNIVMDAQRIRNANIQVEDMK